MNIKSFFIFVIFLLAVDTIKAQSAWQFDGINDYVEVQDYAKLHRGTKEFTIEISLAEINFLQTLLPSVVSEFTLMDKRDVANSKGIRWSIKQDSIIFQIENEIVGVAYAFGNGCKHLAVVRSKDKLEFYVDGFLVGNKNILFTHSMDSDTPLFIGANANQQLFFKGQMDEIRIWGDIRTLAEINSYKNTCLPKSEQTEDLLGYWNLEENRGGFGNNLASFLHYARMGGEVNEDNQEPNWVTSNCAINACCAIVADFSISSEEISATQPIWLYNNAIAADSIWWIFNEDTISSTLSGMDSIFYTFEKSQNIAQIIAFSGGCNSVYTMFLSAGTNILPFFSCLQESESLCNLVCNGSFDEAVTANAMANIGIANGGILDSYAEFPLGYGRGLALYSNTPDLLNNVVTREVPGWVFCENIHRTTFADVNTRSHGIFAGIIQGFKGLVEGAHFPLRTSLLPGISYTMSMRIATACEPEDVFVVFCTKEPSTNPLQINDVQTYPPTTPSNSFYNASQMGTLYPFQASNLDIGAEEMLILSPPYQISNDVHGYGFKWTYLTKTFTVQTPISMDGGIDNIIISMRPNLGDPPPFGGFSVTGSYYFIDDIKIIPENTPSFTIETPENITICAGQTITIPCTITTTQPPITVNIGATSSFGNIPNSTYNLNSTTTIINITIQAPIAQGNYTININANSPSVCLDAISPLGNSVNVQVTPLNIPPALTQTILNNTVNVNAGYQQITLLQRVCAPIGTTTNTICTLQTQLPSGWTQISGNPFRVLNLPANGCLPSSSNYFISVYRRPIETDYCNLDREICAILSGYCLQTVEDCEEISMNNASLPKIIDASVPNFSAAIVLGLLAPPANMNTATQNVVFLGDIIQDLPLPNNFYTFANNSKIRIASGARIIIPNNAELRINDSHVFAGCDKLWKSISVESGGKLRLNNSIVEDGLYAIEARGKAELSIKNSNLRRNYVGILIPMGIPIANTVYFSEFYNNLLEGPTSAPFLLDAYNGAPVATEKRSYAGMLINDQLALNVSLPLPNFGANVFQNMANGIVAYRSNITIGKGSMRFSNMSDAIYAPLPRGYGIYANADGAAPICFTNFAGFGNANNSTIAFSNCPIGIYSRRTNLTVTITRMNAVNIGVSALFSANRSINISSNRIAARQTGIDLSQNGTTTIASITNNDIAVGGAGMLPFGNAGIAVNNANISDPQLNITRNNIQQNRATYGILLQAQTRGTIAENTISLSSGNNNIFNRFAIASLGCLAATVRCNNISLQGNRINSWGLFVGDSEDCRYACNQLNGTSTGTEFDGDCLGVLGTRFSGNRFQNHDIGLLYSANNTSTGDQVRQGNRWAGNSGGAMHLGSILDYQQSEYFISNSNPQFIPSSTFPNSGWFVAQSGNSFDCAATNTCSNPFLPPAFAPTLRQIDTLIATNTSNPTTPAIWAQRRMLYEKLDKNPQWRNGVFAQFYNQQTALPLSEVYILDEERQTIVTIDSPQIQLLQQYTNQIKALQDSLIYMDSLQQIIQDTNYIIQRDFLSQQLQQTHQNALSFCVSLHNNCINNTQIVLSDNNTISTSFIVEQNEKNFNEIYLQTAAVGNEIFTPTQAQLLMDIANQCPVEGGSVVYKARSLYQLVEPTVFSNNCNQPQAKMTEIKQDTVICYDTVGFSNPSFEGTPDSDVPPPSWSICLNSPDTQPTLPPFPTASEGNTYLGLVSINDDFTEAVCQKLKDTLYAGINYSFLIDIAHGTPPVGYRANGSIWLGNYLGHRAEQIHFLEPQDTLWRTDTVRFMPSQSYSHILFSSEFYQPSGGIFIDNVRPLLFACDTISTNVSSIKPQLISMEDEAYFHLYPNPNSNGELTVEWGDFSASSIYIVDALGQRVANYTISSNGILQQQIDIKSLPDGFYFVLLQTEKQFLARKKLIVTK